MAIKPLRALSLSLLLACVLVPAAVAAPPPGSTANCLGGGYNPDALTNICTGTLLETPDHAGQVSLAPGPCVIGQTCVPLPSYDPDGGASLPPVAIPKITYADVNGGSEQFCEASTGSLFDVPSASCTGVCSGVVNADDREMSCSDANHGGCIVVQDYNFINPTFEGRNFAGCGFYEDSHDEGLFVGDNGAGGICATFAPYSHGYTSICA